MFSTNKTGLFVEFDRPFYYPGDNVKGNVYVNIHQSFQSSGIELVVKAKESILYKDVERQAYQAQRENSQTRRMETYTAYRYVNVIRQDKQEVFKYKCMLYNCNSSSFQGGQYCYPFSFKLLNNLSGSFEYYDNDISASIMHTVKAKFQNSRDKVSSTNILIVRQPFTSFNYPKSANQNIKMDVCCAENGMVNFSVQSEKNHVSPGENIIVFLALDNSKSKVTNTSIHINIIQEINVVQRGKKAKIQRRTIVTQAQSKILMPGETEKKKFQLVVEDPNNPTMRNLNKCKHYDLFKDKSVISKLQASCKSTLISCSYHLRAYAIYEGCCSKQPTITIPLLFYIPEVIENYKFIRPNDFNPQIFNSCNVDLPFSSLQEMSPQISLPVVIGQQYNQLNCGMNSDQLIQSAPNNQMVLNPQIIQAQMSNNFNPVPPQEGFSST